MNLEDYEHTSVIGNSGKEYNLQLCPFDYKHPETGGIILITFFNVKLQPIKTSFALTANLRQYIEDHKSGLYKTLGSNNADIYILEEDNEEKRKFILNDISHI